MNLGKLKPLVNDPMLWEAFKEFLDYKLSLVHTAMERDSEANNLFKYQGEASVYRRLLMLREEVNGPK